MPSRETDLAWYADGINLTHESAAPASRSIGSPHCMTFIDPCREKSPCTGTTQTFPTILQNQLWGRIVFNMASTPLLGLTTSITPLVLRHSFSPPGHHIANCCVTTGFKTIPRQTKLSFCVLMTMLFPTNANHTTSSYSILSSSSYAPRSFEGVPTV